MDIEHHYLEKGEGEPFLLLHGNGEDSAYFNKQIEYFSKSYRVIAIDTRGHGKTPRGNAPFTISQFAEDLYIFMDRMGIEKAHLLGFSDGANIAMIFAINYPERVGRLILNGGNLDYKGMKLWVRLPILIEYKLSSLFAHKNPQVRQKSELLGLMVNDPNLKPEELKKITVPTLVIAGTKDMIRDTHTELIYQSIPHAKIALIPGGHFIADRNAALFNQTIEEFLKEQP